MPTRWTEYGKPIPFPDGDARTTRPDRDEGPGKYEARDVPLWFLAGLTFVVWAVLVVWAVVQ